MTVLALDTSTSRGHIAVLVDDEVAFEEVVLADRAHGGLLFPALEKAARSVPAITQIAIGLGPGSYAGVRIGIAAAIGFELALGVPLIGIISLAAFATEATEYLSIGDARRETFYFAHVLHGTALEGPDLLTRAQLSARLASLAHLPVYSCAAIPAFPAAQIVFPCAVKIARLAAAQRGIIRADALEPLYLREPHITEPR